MAIIEPGPRDADRAVGGPAGRVFGADPATVARRAALTRPEEALGCEIVDTCPGRIAGTMPAPLGRPDALGWLAFLIDALGGRPVHALLPASSAPRTVELRIDATGERARPGELLSGTGEVDSLDEWSGLSHVRVHGANGRLLGIGTGRFAVVPEEPFEIGWTLPATPGSTFGADPSEFLLARPYGIGVLVPLRPDLANQYGAVHGGVHGLAAEVALDRAVAGDGPAPGRLQTLNISYLRPALTAHGNLEVSAETTKVGRRVVTAAGAMVGSGDRVLATFDGTYLRGAR